VSLEFVVLGVTSVCIELPVLLAYGHLAGRGGAVLRNSRMADRMAGAFLVATAARLATVRRG
jgi:threonine/homoserine/homoserine lactone efflux protein